MVQKAFCHNLVYVVIRHFEYVIFELKQTYIEGSSFKPSFLIKNRPFLMKKLTLWMSFF